jgi:hypothetical protein
MKLRNGVTLWDLTQTMKLANSSYVVRIAQEDV